jgi:hypothetical protein
MLTPKLLAGRSMYVPEGGGVVTRHVGFDALASRTKVAVLLPGVPEAATRHSVSPRDDIWPCQKIFPVQFRSVWTELWR